MESKPDSGKRKEMDTEHIKELVDRLAASEARALQERNSKEYFMGQMNIHKKECAEKGQKINELNMLSKQAHEIWKKETMEKDKEIKKLRQDAVQECCICGRYVPCNEVSIGGGVHFRCCSRDCLNKLFEHEDKLKEDALVESGREIAYLQKLYNDEVLIVETMRDEIASLKKENEAMEIHMKNLPLMYRKQALSELRDEIKMFRIVGAESGTVDMAINMAYEKVLKAISALQEKMK